MTAFALLLLALAGSAGLNPSPLLAAIGIVGLLASRRFRAPVSTPAMNQQAEDLVGILYPRIAGCWLLIGPATRQQTCRLPVWRDGLCRWHAAFAAKVQP